MKKVRIVPMRSCKKVISDGGSGVSVEVGSSGFGFNEDSQAFIRITELGVGFRGRILRDDKGRLESMELSIHGDDGIIMLMDALDFAAKELVRQISEGE